MSTNFWFALVFFTFLICVAGWKWWAWLLWKYLRLKKEEQVFNLLSKYRFIEITGPSGKGKSWFLAHLFKHLQGVKFTNFPTPQSNYTLSKETLEIHLTGKWDAPHKWYYFLDDLTTFDQWSQREFGFSGYAALQDYIAHAGKLGGTFLWTSNGSPSQLVWQTNKNKTWKVLTYITFLDKSLLFVQANDSWYNFLPTILALDNKEIQAFYDAHWNIPKELQKNYLTYVAEKLQAEELKAILVVIEEGGENFSKKDYDHNVYQKLLTYVKLREKEEEVVRTKSSQISQLKKKLKRYGASDKKITPADIAKWDKEEKRRKRKTSPKPELVAEEDLDQADGEELPDNSPASLENTPKKPTKLPKKSNTYYRNT